MNKQKRNKSHKNAVYTTPYLWYRLQIPFVKSFPKGHHKNKESEEN